MMQLVIKAPLHVFVELCIATGENTGQHSFLNHLQWSCNYDRLFLCFYIETRQHKYPQKAVDQHSIKKYTMVNL